MDKRFVLGKQKWQIDPSLKLIKKDLLDVLYDGNEIIEKSREIAKSVEKQANEDYDRRYKEGFEIGRNDGKEEYTFKIMEMVLIQVDSLEGLERQLVEVVINAINKVIGSLNNDEIIIRIVRKALNAVRGEKRILIRVNPNQESVIRQELRAFLISDDGRTGYIEVLGDPNLQMGDCLLESQMGVVQAGLESQLKVIEKALKDRVGQA